MIILIRFKIENIFATVGLLNFLTSPRLANFGKGFLAIGESKIVLRITSFTLSIPQDLDCSVQTLRKISWFVATWPALRYHPVTYHLQTKPSKTCHFEKLNMSRTCIINLFPRKSMSWKYLHGAGFKGRVLQKMKPFNFKFISFLYLHRYLFNN